MAYAKQGRWEEAERLLLHEAAEKLSLHVLETRETKYEVEYPDTLKIMNNLTRIYIEQNRWEEAEKLAGGKRLRDCFYM
ncbi:hypothetical protein VTI28DRAFT_7310 [Corynascus sepedonium]